jgi:hypothetical protein
MAKKLALIPMKTRIAAIQSTYASAAERIIKALSSLDPDPYVAAKSGAVLSEVKGIIGSLDAAVQKWAPRAIRAAYKESAGVARTRLEMIGAEKLPAKKYDPARHGKKISALTKTVMTDYWKANRTIERTARKYLSVVSQAAAGVKKVEQAQMFDSAEVRDFIKRTVSGSLRAATKYNAGMAHLTSKDIAAKIRAKLLNQIGGGNFIRIKGKDGVEREYNLRSYAELVARTRMRESQTEAVKELCAQFDNDLVEIPRHDNPCDECAQYQGQIYSISGKHPDYPELPDGGPPWHPYCEDVANPVSENALAWRNR